MIHAEYSPESSLKPLSGLLFIAHRDFSQQLVLQTNMTLEAWPWMQEKTGTDGESPILTRIVGCRSIRPFKILLIANFQHNAGPFQKCIKKYFRHSEWKLMAQLPQKVVQYRAYPTNFSSCTIYFEGSVHNLSCVSMSINMIDMPISMFICVIMFIYIYLSICIHTCNYR